MTLRKLRIAVIEREQVIVATPGMHPIIQSEDKQATSASLCRMMNENEWVYMIENKGENDKDGGILAKTNATNPSKNQIQFNSIQFNSIQFNSIQFNKWKLE